jgi:DNA-directed RNA polymerase specialized sigma24 family protein
MQTQFPLLDPDVIHPIHQAAVALSRSHGFAAHEREDIEQDLLLHVWMRRTRFDASRGSPGSFATIVARSQAISKVRHRMCAKRSPLREQCSLNQHVVDGDGRTVEVHETIAGEPGTAAASHDLRQDVATILASMSALHRAIAVALGNGTLNVVVRERNIQLEDVERHIAEIRKTFEDAGMRDYL